NGRAIAISRTNAGEIHVALRSDHSDRARVCVSRTNRLRDGVRARTVATSLGGLSMAKAIRRVAVLGSGVMGSGIAAHMANAGLEVLLLDIAPKDPKA